MKRIITYNLLVLLLLSLGLNQKGYTQELPQSTSTTEVVIANLDTLVLRLDDYVGEFIQWQQSSDMLVWIDLPQANTDTLAYVAPATSVIYFRAKVVAGCCDPFISGVIMVQSFDFSEVTTETPSSISALSAVSGGQVATDGGSPITSKGVVWSTLENPTVEQNSGITNDGTGTASYVSSITGLSASISYYVRAYATTSVGTSYGQQETFNTRDGVITLSTADITAITATTATSGGDITDDGGAPVAARGIVWNTAESPTLEMNEGFTSNDSGDGQWVSELIELTYNTTYYVRSYATNAVGTRYGEAKSFTTLATTPQVTTAEVTDITSSSAVSGGEVISDGGSIVTVRGVVISTNQNPTLEDNEGLTETGSGLGEFISELSGLAVNTVYYIKAYATNQVGTAYGNELAFTTLDYPTVTTADISSVTTSTAVSGGEVTNDGGAPVTVRGLVWSTTQNPTLIDNQGFTEIGTGIGEFTSELTGLIQNTIYYVRAYASNEVGTAYGEQISFRSLQSSIIYGNGVTDIDGNVYETVIIGGQEWMAKNLLVTKYQNGDPIPTGLNNTEWENTTVGAHAIYPYTEIEGHNSSAEVVATYGILYNWYTVNDVRGLCPTGWHTPTDVEWYTMENYIDPTINDPNATGWRGTDADTKLKAKNGWIYDSNGNDIFGFGGIPSGERSSSGGYGNVGYLTYWWTSTENDASYSWSRLVRFENDGITRYDERKANGYSVRCIKDSEIEPILPSLVTTVVSNITSTSASSGGNITDDGNAAITARGIVWSTTQNPTVETNEGITSDGNGTGEFISELTGLLPNTTYYVRAYATNSVSTGYGEQVTFITLAGSFVCGDNVTFTYRGQTVAYGTVEGQNGTCWLDRNLGASRVATSSTDAEAYGDLFQWGRASDGHQVRTSGTTETLSDSDTPEHSNFILVPDSPYDWRSTQNDNLWQGDGGVNDVCPTGWRVPTEAELNIERLSWGSNNSEGAFASPLKLPVAGRRASNASLNGIGSDGHYWSSTVDGSYSRYLFFLSSSTSMYSNGRALGYSVRCIKNTGDETTIPSVTTTEVSSITATTATSGGNVTNNGGATITARGVCWSTSQNPTIVDSITEDGTGTGTFTSSITGLAANTTYYVRAYATNSIGTAYGEQKTFTTATVPTVITADISNILTTTATGGGNVTASGGVAVTAKGVVWSTSQNPTTTTNLGITTNGTGTGSFTSELTELTEGTTYYVRAYATNEAGTAYGEEKSFATIALPTLTSAEISNLASTSITTGGNITSDGGAAITARGVCWGTVSNPTLENNFTEDGSGVGEFVSNLTGLTPTTTYYIRAYATSLAGTAYGNEVTFNTISTTQIADIDNNVYNTVTIGEQVWMKENLKTTKFSNGVAIPNVTDNNQWSNLTSYAYSEYDNNTANVSTYGRLYNSYAVFSNNELCPTGWRMPTIEDVQILYATLGGTEVAGGKMKTTGTSHWNSPNEGATNESGFSGLPGGMRYGITGNFGEKGGSGVFALKMINGNYLHQFLGLQYYNANSNIGSYSSYDNEGYSVRCIQGEDTNYLPIVSLNEISSITNSSGSIYGNINYESGIVSERGYYWSVTPNAEISGTKIAVGGDNYTSFTSTLSGLNPNTTYYIKGYAINTNGTAYSEEISFTTLPIAQPIFDIDGNEYSTANYGTHIWMTENLRTSKYRNGDDIPNLTLEADWGATASGAWCYHSNNDANNIPFGKLYNFYTTVDVRGLCPEGWHVPTQQEWITLVNYLGGIDVAGGKMKIEGYTYWESPNTGATNESGFNAYGAGSRTQQGDSFDPMSQSCAWWSTTIPTEYPTRGYNTILNHTSEGANYNYDHEKKRGIGVRCVRDLGLQETIPTISTDELTNITISTATSGGNITNSGGSTVTTRGVVWSTTENPTIETNDGITTDGTGTGEFVSELTGLTPSTTYYVRAYATNSIGTGYGEQQSFSTYAVMDIDGNIYNTVIIGEQVWMAENLKVTKYRNGDPIPTNLDNTEWQNTSNGAYAIYAISTNHLDGLNSDEEVLDAYGALYNWFAVIDSRGLCPIGWHIPADYEWTNLVDYLASQGYPNTDVTLGAGNALKSCQQNSSPLGGNCNTNEHPRWHQSDTHYGTDLFLFSALPSGYRSYYTGFGGAGVSSNLWSISELDETEAWYSELRYDNGHIISRNALKNHGFTVRCIKDVNK